MRHIIPLTHETKLHSASIDTNGLLRALAEIAVVLESIFEVLGLVTGFIDSKETGSDLPSS